MASGSGNGENGGGQGHGGAGGHTSTSQWIAAGVSLLLVLGTVGFLLYEAFALPETPPRLTVSVDSVFPVGEGWQVDVSVVNDGTRTAASVQVSGEAGGQTSLAALDYVPAGATRRVTLLFGQDPRQGGLRVRVMGFDDP